MTVVAEGVETALQSDTLQAAGVDATQGFLTARPMSDSDVAMWLVQWARNRA